MRYAAVPVFVILLAAAPALAAPSPNLSVNLTGPTSAPNVYAYAGYSVSVENIGNRDADGVELIVQLPKTGTSPQVYVMGTVGAFDSRCMLGAFGTLKGTKLTCGLGTVRKGRSTNVVFNVAFPEKTGDLVINAAATTTTVVFLAVDGGIWRLANGRLTTADRDPGARSGRPRRTPARTSFRCAKD